MKKQRDFQRAARTGRFFRIAYLSIKVACQKKGGATRFGIPISTKVAKKAVERNRMRRRVREAIRLILPNIAEGFDVIIFPSRSTLEVPFQEIINRLENLFKRAGILKSEKRKPKNVKQQRKT